jgi:ABC-type multidrug transport system ATPase subunit
MPDACRRLALFELMYFATLELCSTATENSSIQKALKNLNHLTHCPKIGVHFTGLAGIPAFEELKSEGIVRRAAAKGDANNVFRNILWLLKQQLLDWAAFIEDFNFIFPNLTVTVSFDKLKDEHINAYITEGKKSLPIDALGTGVLQTIQILSYIHLYRPKLLILDEPDSHLHPSNQRLLAQLLSELAKKYESQIILSTHSRHLLDAIRGDATITWISNGELRNEPYNFISVLLEIGALDKGDIINNGKTKCVVLTEDSKTVKLQTLLQANDFNLDETDIWSYDGCSKVETAIVLGAFINKNAPGTKVIIHRDSDYLQNADINSIKEKLTRAGLFSFFTKGTDIESYFLDIDHINTIYPTVQSDVIESLIGEATNELEEKSIQLFTDSAFEVKVSLQYSGGERAKAGDVALKCRADYLANKERYRQGKRVFNRLKETMQTKYGAKDLVICSKHLKTAELEAIKNEIWKSSLIVTKANKTTETNETEK